MPLPIDARPSPVPGHTEIIFDDGDSMYVEDPEGSFLTQGRSLAQERGAGSFGADPRTAQAPGGMSYGGNFTPEQGNSMVDAVTAIGDAVAPGMPGTPRAAEVASRAAPPPEGAPPPDPLAAQADAISAQASEPAAAPAGQQFIVAPGTKGGWQNFSKQIEGLDLSPEARAQVESVLRPAYEKQEQADASANTARRQVNANQQARAAAEAADLSAKMQAKQEEQAHQAAAVAETSRQLDEVSKQGENPGRLWGNVGFALSAMIGSVASQVLQLRNPETRAAETFWKNINGLIDNDIQSQRNNKNSVYSRLRERFQDDRIALETTRSMMKEYVRDLAASNKDLARSQDEALTYKALEDKAEADRTAAYTNAATALLPKVSSSQRYAQATGPTVMTIPSAQLRAAGISEKAYQEAMNDKIDPGMPNAPSVSNAISGLTNLDGDIALKEALSAGKVVPRSFWAKASQSVRDAAGAVGIDTTGSTAVTADQIEALDARVITKIAKGYGGAITAPDAENAAKEYGRTPQQQLGYLKRQRTEAQQRVNNALNARFPGKENDVLRIRRGAVGNVSETAPSEGARRIGSAN